MQPRRMEALSEFDYSVRVNLANSALCGGQREATVAVKLHLSQQEAGEERQVDAHLAMDCKTTIAFSAY